MKNPVPTAAALENLKLGGFQGNFKRERIEYDPGNFRYRCTHCGEYKFEKHFQKRRRNRWGLDGNCKLCVSKKRLVKDKADKEQERLKKYRRNKTKHDQAADKKYENWIFRQEQGLKVALGKPGWSKDFGDCCSGCGTFFHKHHAKGMCTLCYHRDYYGITNHHQFNRRGKWSRLHDHCKTCGGTESPHGSKGDCKRCYARKRTRPQVAPNRCCHHCKKPIDKDENTKKKFCSDSCAQKSARRRKGQIKGKHCVACGVHMPEAHGRTKWCNECHPRKHRVGRHKSDHSTRPLEDTTAAPNHQPGDEGILRED